MGSCAVAIFEKNGRDIAFSNYSNAFDIPINDINGIYHHTLRDFVENKKAIIIVNVASK